MAKARSNESRDARRFGVILAILLGLFSAWSAWRGRPTRTILFGAASVAVASCTFLLFPIWLALFRRWMKVALFLSAVMTAVLLGLFFYLILTPFGLLRRLFGKPALDLGWRDGKSTYWIDRDPGEPTLERYEKPF